METITLPTRLKDQIISHAASSSHMEVCGLIGSINNQPSTVYPVKNIADDQAKNFLMDPEAQIDAMKQMRDKQEELWGIYHSHPESSAMPSEIDLNMAAYPGVYYFVVSLEKLNPEITAWWFDGKTFLAVELI